MSSLKNLIFQLLKMKLPTLVLAVNKAVEPHWTNNDNTSGAHQKLNLTKFLSIGLIAVFSFNALNATSIAEAQYISPIYTIDKSNSDIVFGPMIILNSGSPLLTIHQFEEPWTGPRQFLEQTLVNMQNLAKVLLPCGNVELCHPVGIAVNHGDKYLVWNIPSQEKDSFFIYRQHGDNLTFLKEFVRRSDQSVHINTNKQLIAEATLRNSDGSYSLEVSDIITGRTYSGRTSFGDGDNSLFPWFWASDALISNSGQVWISLASSTGTNQARVAILKDGQWTAKFTVTDHIVTGAMRGLYETVTGEIIYLYENGHHYAPSGVSMVSLKADSSFEAVDLPFSTRIDDQGTASPRILLTESAGSLFLAAKAKDSSTLQVAFVAKNNQGQWKAKKLWTSSIVEQPDDNFILLPTQNGVVIAFEEILTPGRASAVRTRAYSLGSNQAQIADPLLSFESCRLIDAVTDNNQFYLATEFYRGPTLESLFNSQIQVYKQVLQ